MDRQFNTLSLQEHEEMAKAFNAKFSGQFSISVDRQPFHQSPDSGIYWDTCVLRALSEDGRWGWVHNFNTVQEAEKFIEEVSISEIRRTFLDEFFPSEDCDPEHPKWEAWPVSAAIVPWGNVERVIKEFKNWGKGEIA